MKLLKKDHYTITRLLLEDSDGKLYEVEAGSLGHYRISPWDGKADGVMTDESGEYFLSWEKYSRLAFDGQIDYGWNKALSEEEEHKEVGLILPPELVSEIRKIAKVERRSFDQELNHLVDLGIKVVEEGAAV